MTESQQSGSASRRARAVDLVLVAVTGAVDLAFWQGDRDLVGGATLPPWVIPLAVAGLCSALLFRRRFPLRVWLAAWLYTGVNLVVPAYYPFAFLLVASYAVASGAPGRTARLVLVATAVPFALFSYRFAQAEPAQSQLRGFLAALLAWLVFLGIAWGLGRFAHTREEHARAERERLAAAAEKELAAQRLRLAHELHDSVTGAVAGIILHAGAARVFAADADRRVRQALEVIEQAGTQAMTELHSMLGLLRSTEPDGAARVRFADVERLLDAARRADLDVRLDVTGTARPLAPEADLAAYRIVQESLTNVTKHAGRGATVTLGVVWTEQALDLTVRSHGGTAPPATAALSTGAGLRGLGERLGALGGELTSGPAADGWCVHATVPAPSEVP
ncbi:sensor histidine kinase [Nocardia brasiliensis]|uniref:sensor histidine kinase n=1 Tax=Nocardia brasiliensis TaxID=37326 RepID=UPI001EEAA3CE|nr:histidine kinase [Nocardia brasiliensis]